MNAMMPTSLPAEFLDEIVAATIELRFGGLMHLFMTFPQRLDPARMARAARLLADAEPILGCRFTLEQGKPRWQRHADMDSVSWFTHTEAADAHAAIVSVIGVEEPLGERNLIVRLFSLPDADLLCLTLSHAVADGAAALDCSYQLAGLYSILATRPMYQPEPNLASRDSFAWTRGLTLRHKARTVLRDLAELRHVGKRPIGVATTHTPASWATVSHDAPAYVLRRITPAELDAIDRLAVAHACGRLEFLLAGLARAFADFTGARDEQPFRVLLPSNLRRFDVATRRPPIRNMAGVATLTFPTARGEPFSATLAAVRREARRMRDGLGGAMNPVAASILKAMSYDRKRRAVASVFYRGLAKSLAPTFSNVGRLREASLRFDGTAPADAYIVPGTSNLPVVVVAGLEYRRTLTLSIAFEASETPPARMQAFLDDLVGQIPIAAA